jgi:hypothetical protein
MDVHAELIAPCGPDELYGWVEDLGGYPRWLEIVTRAEPLDGDAAASGAAGSDGAGSGDDRPAWAVDLRGRLGPLARSKRLRMVRTVHDGRTARFERAELDGRAHSPWILDATVEEHPDGSRLAMRLHYGGGLFGPVLERVLKDEITRSKDRLLTLVTT